VAIFVDDNPTPSESPRFRSSVDIQTTASLADGTHKFVAKQSISYGSIVEGNHTIPRAICTAILRRRVNLTVDSPPTAVAKLSGVTVNGQTITFTVDYSNQGDLVLISTIDNNDIRVTGPNGFSQLATLNGTPVSNADRSTVTATYQINPPLMTWGPLTTFTVTMLAIK